MGNDKRDNWTLDFDLPRKKARAGPADYFNYCPSSRSRKEPALVRKPTGRLTQRDVTALFAEEALPSASFTRTVTEIKEEAGNCGVLFVRQTVTTKVKDRRTPRPSSGAVFSV